MSQFILQFRRQKGREDFGGKLFAKEGQRKSGGFVPDYGDLRQFATFEKEDNGVAALPFPTTYREVDVARASVNSTGTTDSNCRAAEGNDGKAIASSGGGEVAAG